MFGWATASLVSLDVKAPGLIRRLLTASPMVRQAVFTILAHQVAFGGGAEELRLREGDVADMATMLRDGRAREILRLSFDCVPDAWLGALSRLGGLPLANLSAYSQLRMIVCDGRHVREAEALRQVGRITANMFVVLDVLDERWIHAAALGRLPNALAAKDFNRAIAFAQSVCTKATDEAVGQAIAQLRPATPLSSVVARFVRRADKFPPHPLPHDFGLRPLLSARDFIEAGRRYRNCLATKLEEALVGLVAFAEFEGSAIVELRPLSQGMGWVVHQVHVVRNGFVDPDLARAVIDRCGSLGVPCLDVLDGGEDWRRYRRFVRSGGWLVQAA